MFWIGFLSFPVVSFLFLFLLALAVEAGIVPSAVWFWIVSSAVETFSKVDDWALSLARLVLRKKD